MSDATKEKVRHTPGPWRVNNDGPVLGVSPVSDDYVGKVCDMRANLRHFARDPCVEREMKANARRIVAAVNACEGIPVEALEDGVVGDLLEAAKVAENEICALLNQMTDEQEVAAGPTAARVYGQLADAIAKAEGADHG